MKIGVGVFLLLAIIVLYVLNLKFKKEGKKSKKINKVIYILMLIFITSLSYAATLGIDYACPCGCGSTEYDLGFKGMLNFFTEISYGIFDSYSYAKYVITWGCIVHFILLSIIIVTKKIRNSREHREDTII